MWQKGGFICPAAVSLGGNQKKLHLKKQKTKCIP